MATHFINTTVGGQSLGHQDRLLLTSTGRIEEAVGTGISTSGTDHDVTLDLHGSVYAASTAINLFGTSAGHAVSTGDGHYRVTIAPGATVASATSAGIDMFGGDNVVANGGTIHSFSNGIKFLGETGKLINTGTIVSSDGDAIWVNPAPGDPEHHVVNSGVISGYAALTNSGTTDLFIENSGMMISWTFSAIFHSGGRLKVINSGTISGNGSYDTQTAVNVWAGTVAAYADAVVNTGQIKGGVYLRDGNDSVRNSGLIDGNVDLGDGVDTYDGLGGGEVNGFVNLGNHDDTAHVDNPNILINGGAGFDVLYLHSDQRGASHFELVQMQGARGYRYHDDATDTRVEGNAGDNMIDGGAGHDTLLGGMGDDDLRGSEGDDLIIGNSGEDEIDGGLGHDEIYGGRGADEIFGGYGNDTIYGGAGDDSIYGGGAKDILMGGHGNDVFIFESGADVGSGSNADRIDNFVRGEDLIDLVGLGTTPASFIGTAGFTGGGNMEVRYTVNAFGNAMVRIDEDGDGAEDARLVVSQTTALDAGDFLL